MLDFEGEVYTLTPVRPQRIRCFSNGMLGNLLDLWVFSTLYQKLDILTVEVFGKR